VAWLSPPHIPTFSMGPSYVADKRKYPGKETETVVQSHGPAQEGLAGPQHAMGRSLGHSTTTVRQLLDWHCPVEQRWELTINFLRSTAKWLDVIVANAAAAEVSPPSNTRRIRPPINIRLRCAHGGGRLHHCRIPCAGWSATLGSSACLTSPPLHYATVYFINEPSLVTATCRGQVLPAIVALIVVRTG